MKKLSFLALLALSILSCAICMPAAIAEDAGYEYTQELVYEEFHLFIPSTFQCLPYGYQYTERPDYLKYAGVYAAMPLIAVNSCHGIDSGLPISYRNAADLAEVLAFYCYDADSYIPVKADECAGILYLHAISVGYMAGITITNRKHLLNIVVYAATAEETLELAYGLLDHMIAPEMPLEEGMTPASVFDSLPSGEADMLRPAPTPNRSAEDDAAALSADSAPNNPDESDALTPEAETANATDTDSSDSQGSLAQQIQSLIPRFTLLFMLSL